MNYHLLAKLDIYLNFCRKLIGYKGYAYAAVTKMSTKLKPKEFRQLIEFSYKNVKLYPKFKITGRM